MKIKDVFLNQSLNKPYIIAEAGVNHEGSIDTAKKLIELAAEGGANAIKFQSYKASTLASKNSPSYWDLSKEPTTNQYDLFKKHDKFWKSEFEKLKNHCDKIGIEFMSTPFDNESALFLNDLMDVYKISSSDITNKPFIDFICKFNKPIILSTGASYLHEIRESHYWINKNGNDLALLHCVLNYPTDNINAKLSSILDLKKVFSENIIGYSDHTMPENMDTILYSFIMGALIIEKHFTHDKTLKGNDHYHAMDIDDLKLFNKKLNNYLSLLGNNKFNDIENQSVSRDNARRSIYLNNDINKGDTISESDIITKRPFKGGIHPKYFSQIIGKKIIKNKLDDEQLQWGDFS